MTAVIVTGFLLVAAVVGSPIILWWERRTPLTGEQLAAKHGFNPHGKDPLTGGPKRKGGG